VIAKNNFSMEDRHFVPLNPEHHLTPARLPTPWRRGTQNRALAIISGLALTTHGSAGIFSKICFGNDYKQWFAFLISVYLSSSAVFLNDC